MRAFEANVVTIILRFYLMMVLVVVPFLIGIPALAILAVPVFWISLIGLSFKSTKPSTVTTVKHLSRKVADQQAA